MNMPRPNWKLMVERLENENRRLSRELEQARAFVHAAYIEGFLEGMREYASSKGGKRWNESRICRKLALNSPWHHDRAVEKLTDDLALARAELEEARAALDRYRYVYHWWASDSYDRGGEFNARLNWARGEDIGPNYSPDDFANIGKQFLERTGRALNSPERQAPSRGSDEVDPYLQTR